jgi:hypothetical protein
MSRALMVAGARLQGTESGEPVEAVAPGEDLNVRVAASTLVSGGNLLGSCFTPRG